jgi:Tfp pilus assembly protein FimT
MIELVVVVMIILVVGGLVIPNALQLWYNVQLRSSAAQVSDLMQQTRILAAKNNTTYSIRYKVNNGVQQAY